MTPEDLSARLTYPYLAGVFLAVNAVPDAFLVIDGPGCVFYRTTQIHGRHDWASTLLSCEGRHRVQFAGVDVNSIASDYEGMLRDVVRRVAADPGAGLVLLCSLPTCTIAGTDYAAVLRSEAAAKPAREVPSRSLSADWLEGYAEALHALASGLDLTGARPRPGNVAVVGYLMDRNEGDHRGAVAELRRMLAALGLEPGSVWLSGGSYAELERVRDASAIVSLPHGRKAASGLAGRLGVPLIEAALPVGLDGTAAWLRAVASATGRQANAEAFIEAELRRVAPRLEWVVPHLFAGRTAAYVGEPHATTALSRMAEEWGLETRKLWLTGRSPLKETPSGWPDADWEPRATALRSGFSALERDGLDLLVANSDALTLLQPRCRSLELGFPSIGRHALRDEPWLGFEGCLALADRFAAALGAPEPEPRRAARPVGGKA